MNEFLYKVAILGGYVAANFVVAACGEMFGIGIIYDFFLKTGTLLAVFLVIYCFMDGLIWLACKAFDLDIKSENTDKFCVTKCKWYELCDKDYQEKEPLK